MLDGSKFAVSGHTGLLSSKTGYDIADGDSGKPLATATEKTTFLATLLGMAMGKDNMSKTIEVRKKSDDALLFSVCRSGFLFKKVQVLDAEGKVLAVYKAKMMSMSGGFHVYDPEGKHLLEIKGKMFKSEYQFVTPDAKPMGSVSRTWGGMAKSLLGGSGSYGVQIDPTYANDKTMKTIILGAAIAVDSMFKKAGSTSSAGGDE
jgi:uncharacterized protein YxjI